MLQSKKKLGLLVTTIVLLLCLSACGSSPITGEKVNLPQASTIDNPFAVLQAETDKFLKQNRTLTIEPQEILDKVVNGGDRKYYLVDIRSDEHYANAFIPGAVHIAYADTWREQKWSFLPKDKQIVVIDYSGHTASQVAAFWSMLGYDAIAMKGGMTGWSRDKDVIGGTPVSCDNPGNPVVTTVTAGQSFDLPKLDTKGASLVDLLVQRAQAAGEILPVMQVKDFREKAGDFFVVDVRQAEHYAAGHINGAVNIPFRTIAEMDNLKKIPVDKNLMLVGYDAYAASQAARLLNQLGYKATVLKDGMSAWVSDEKIIGAKPLACNVTEKPVAKLNAPLKPGPSSAAT